MLYMPCPFSTTVFGAPNEGIHAARIGPFAAVDTVGTAVIALAIAMRLRPKAWARAFLPIFAVLMVLSVAVHRLFCVDTALVTMLGLAVGTPIPRCAS